MKNILIITIIIFSSACNSKKTEAEKTENSESEEVEYTKEDMKKI